MFAGHTHGPTPHFVPGCPLCDAAKAARNQAIEHLAEALHLLANLRGPEDRPTLRLNLGPIGVTGDDAQRCHSIDLTAKLAEGLADAIDSMNAYLGSEQPAPADPAQTTVDPALVDEIEQQCIGMDADYLMDIAATNPNKAVAAFDEIFEYASPEQIMREDGGEL